MTWHESAILASCNHYMSQLASLPQEPWILGLTRFYADPHALWDASDLTPLAPSASFESAVNELTLGLGCDAKDARGLIFGLEAAYATPDQAKPAETSQARISYLVEGCVLSALWQKNSDVATIAAIAAGAAAPLEWPTRLPDWKGQQHQFFRNPSHYYQLSSGHTWRKLARVAAGNDVDRLFETHCVFDLSHLPRETNESKTVSVARLSFLTQIVRDYAKGNPIGKLWFHGAGWPVPALR